MTSKIISEFTLLIQKTLSEKEKGSGFKLKIYRNVISILKSCEEEITSTEEALTILRRGGMKLANEKPPKWNSRVLLKIEKILTEGSLGLELDEKTKTTGELLRIPGIGPSKAHNLYGKGIKSIDDLRSNLDLINDKQKIGLRHYRDLEKKIPRAEMLVWQDFLLEIAEEVLGDNLVDAKLVGSFRRKLPRSGDIDFYISVKTIPKSKNNMMQLIYQKLLDNGHLDPNDIFSLGDKKMMAVTRLDRKSIARHLDIFIYPIEQYPFAILYATGSGEFNVKMRNIAIKAGYSLSDSALRLKNNKGPVVTSDKLLEVIGKTEIKNEEDIFQFLKLEYIHPQDRTPIIELKLLS